MILFPDCKINLGLEVLRKRADGYHDIESVMVPVPGLCDILEIVPSGDGVELTVSGSLTGCTAEDNLCTRAYRLLRERYGIPGARMHLHKMIPSGAGLGGGSSDAAFTIKGLNSLFGLGLVDEQMESIAAELGSDVPFFIRNTTQLATGRGEILTPIEIPGLAGSRIVIVKPDVSVSTAQAYSGISPVIPDTSLSQRLRGEVCGWKGTIFNRFEPHIFHLHPILRQIKQALLDSGAFYAAMSGSGSALFGLYTADQEPDLTDLQLFGEFAYQGVLQ